MADRDVRINVIVDVQQAEAMVRQLEQRANSVGGLVGAGTLGLLALGSGGVSANTHVTDPLGVINRARASVSTAWYNKGRQTQDIKTILNNLDSPSARVATIESLASDSITIKDDNFKAYTNGGQVFTHGRNPPFVSGAAPGAALGSGIGYASFDDMLAFRTGGAPLPPRDGRFIDVLSSSTMRTASGGPIVQMRPMSYEEMEFRRAVRGVGKATAPIWDGAKFVTRTGYNYAREAFMVARDNISLSGLADAFKRVRSKVSPLLGVTIPVVGIEGIIQSIRVLSDAKKRQRQDASLGVGSGKDINDYAYQSLQGLSGKIGGYVSTLVEDTITADGVLTEMAEGILGKAGSAFIPASPSNEKYAHARSARRAIEDWFHVREAQAIEGARNFAIASKQWNQAFDQALDAARSSSYDISRDVAGRLQQKGFSGGSNALSLSVRDRVEELLRQQVSDEYGKARPQLIKDNFGVWGYTGAQKR